MGWSGEKGDKDPDTEGWRPGPDGERVRGTEPGAPTCDAEEERVSWRAEVGRGPEGTRVIWPGWGAGRPGITISGWASGGGAHCPPEVGGDVGSGIEDSEEGEYRCG
jgi:hypothetical protein